MERLLSMILILKSHKAGSVSTGAENVLDLASEDDVELIRAEDYGLYGNPDGADGRSAAAMHPDFRGGHPQGPIRSESMSGGGRIHSTKQTSAPMSKPTPAPMGSPQPVSTIQSPF